MNDDKRTKPYTSKIFNWNKWIRFRYSDVRHEIGRTLDIHRCLDAGGSMDAVDISGESWFVLHKGTPLKSGRSWDSYRRFGDNQGAMFSGKRSADYERLISYDTKPFRTLLHISINSAFCLLDDYVVGAEGVRADTPSLNYVIRSMYVVASVCEPASNTYCAQSTFSIFGNAFGGRGYKSTKQYLERRSGCRNSRNVYQMTEWMASDFIDHYDDYQLG